MRKLNCFLSSLLISTHSFAMAEEPPSATDAEALASRMIGSYRTAADDPDNNFMDRRIAINSLGEGEWVYYQLNTGVDSAVYRQRVIQLLDADGTVVQNTFNLLKPEAYENVFDDPAPLAGLTMEHIEPSMPPGCEQIWRYDADVEGGPWVGVVDAAECQIYSERRSANISIGAEVRLNENTLYTTEKGYDLDGNILFGGPKDSFIILQRVTD